MKGRLIFLLVPIAGAACDSVTNRYETLAEARADGLFERGWLPDVLPPSAYDISVRNNLDLNTSEGRFSFAAEDFSRLDERLASLSEQAEASLGPLADAVSTRTGEEYSVYRYRESGRQWAFQCMPEQGYCRYYMQ